MAYIVFVNPSILHETGMPFQAVVAATCFCAAFGSILMGVFARYPIALAPGMGLNAYFTYVVVKGMGIAWPTALGAVFLSGIAFLLLTFLGIRQLIMEAIPRELYAAVAAGIGLFIAMIGLRNAGIIVSNSATLVTLGKLNDKNTLLALFGLIVVCGLAAWGVRAAMLIGILTATLAAGALDPCGFARRAVRNRFRVFVRRFIRQRGYAGGGGQARGAIRCRQPHSSHRADSADGCYGYSGGGGSYCRNGSGADRRWILDDGASERNCLGRSDDCDSGVPYTDYDSVDFFDCERLGVRLHQLRGFAGGAR